MGIVNHKGITVKSSVYPEDWDPSSSDSYNQFIDHVVSSNLKNERTIPEEIPSPIQLRFKGPLSLGFIIEKILKSNGH